MLIGKNRHLRRRAVIGLLLAASLTLLTLSFRQGSEGAIGAIQRGAMAITAPFSAATTRVTKPFVDAWNWTSGLVDARRKHSDALQRANGGVRVQLHGPATDGLFDFGLVGAALGCASEAGREVGPSNQDGERLPLIIPLEGQHEPTRGTGRRRQGEAPANAYLTRLA